MIHVAILRPAIAHAPVLSRRTRAPVARAPTRRRSGGPLHRVIGPQAATSANGTSIAGDLSVAVR